LTALLAGDDFDALFTHFGYTAFRLEVRESYAGMPYEVAPLRQFLAGEDPVDLEWTTGYRALVARHAAAGRRITRVRIVSEPWSEYTRFGIWLAAGTNAAGEDIRYLPRTHPVVAELPHEDFWLFDSQRLYLLHFSADDNLIGAEPVTDPPRIVAANAARDAAWHYAERRDQYAERHGFDDQRRPSA
jgi:Family of unknown function (DUF6879)